MTVMSDTLRRGYAFASATGLKTGANLEDLVARATPVAGSQMVDQSTIETYEDTGLVDDDGNPIYRLRLKDGGVSTAKIADGAVTGDKLAADAWMGPKLTLTTGMIAQSGFTAYDFANAVDGDRTTLTAEKSLPGSPTIIWFYFDLGAVYSGWTRLVFDFKQNGYLYPIATYDTTTDIENNNIFVSNIDADATYRTLVRFAPFTGRYVGWKFYNTSGSATAYLKLRQMEVYGSAFTL